MIRDCAQSAVRLGRAGGRAGLLLFRVCIQRESGANECWAPASRVYNTRYSGGRRRSRVRRGAMRWQRGAREAESMATNRPVT